jgi:hypothetical protein
MLVKIMKSVGKITYAPKTHLNSSEKWAILSCDDEISKYYRTLFYREFPWKGKLNRPVWGAHISFIRSEYIPNNKLWKMDENKIIEFEYEGGVENNDEYYWLKVSCLYLNDLREKYGLSREPRYGLHLTIGRIAND